MKRTIMIINNNKLILLHILFQVSCPLVSYPHPLQESEVERIKQKLVS